MIPFYSEKLKLFYNLQGNINEIIQKCLEALQLP